jgi:hypothetical protein
MNHAPTNTAVQPKDTLSHNIDTLKQQVKEHVKQSSLKHLDELE